VELEGTELRNRVAGLERGFVPPRELTGSRPRDVELTAAGRAVYIVSILLFGSALFVAILLNGELRRQNAEWRAFQSRGTSGTAEVTRLWRTSDDSKQPWVAYRYTVDAGTYEGKAKIRLADWRLLHEGSSLAIRYLSDEPRRSHPASVGLALMPVWVPIMVGLGITTVPILLLVVINSQRRLMADGRSAPALVTKVARHQSSHGGSHRTIRYAFPLLSGSMATGKSDASRKGPVAGSVICIVYDPDRPRRSQPYPFALVRPTKAAR